MMDFLQGVAQKVWQQHGNNLYNVLVLVPNQRTATYFNNSLQQLATRAMLSPQVVTLQQWMMEQSDLVKPDNIELVMALYECHRETGGELPLDDFIGTAGVMLQDFDHIDRELADARLFFSNLEMLQSMKTYVPGEEPDEYKLNYRKFWEDFAKLYYALRQKLLALHQGYSGLILRDVAEKIKQVDLNTYGGIYIAGFNGFNKAEEAAIMHLLGHKAATVFWDADKYYVDDEVNEAGLFMRQYRQRFKIKESEWLNEISTQPKHVEIIGAAKVVGQAKVAADILQNRLALTEANAIETVVVLPDNKLLTPLMNHLPANVSAVNITMGLNLLGTNPATWLEILFRLYENSVKYRSKSGEQRFYYKDVFELLQHNYFALLFGKMEVDRFIDTMKKQNRVLIRRSELVEKLGKQLQQVLFEGEDAGGFAGFITGAIKQLLGAMVEKTRAGETAYAPDAEISARLLGMVNNTTPIFTGGYSITIKSFISLLKQSIREAQVPLEGDPVQGLQVMGLLETRNLDFKNVIFLSANEGILPTGKSQRSYIPYELQSEFLSTYKERDAGMAYLFYRLMHKAQNIFILYNTEPDELGGGEKSRFILQLQHELQLRNKQAVIKDLVFAVDPPLAQEIHTVEVKKEGIVTAKINEILTTSGMSPSALNTYINCTLQYYFRYIAGIKEQDEMEESLEASTIGDAVHYALEKIYTRRKGAVVDETFIKEWLGSKEKIGHFIQERLRERFDNESLSRGRNLLLYKVCIKLTEEFLKHELQNLQLLADTGVTMEIEMLEEKLVHTLQIGDRLVKVQGRVDRIERVGDAVHIADYKTSVRSIIPVLNAETWEALFSDPKYAKPVQLLIYAWLYYHTQNKPGVVIRSGIYWLREAVKKLNTLGLDKENDLIDATIIHTFEEKLKASLAELMNEEVPFRKSEDEKRCIYCEFARICHRD